MARITRLCSLGMVCAFIMTTLPGCVLVPFIQAFKETGATEEDRKALLAEEVKKFSDAIMWGSKPQALSVVSDEARDEIAAQLRAIGEDEKIVDAKVDDIKWGDRIFAANVFLKVRFYKVPFYVVKTRIEEQVWEFSVADGWRLKTRSMDSESHQ